MLYIGTNLKMYKTGTQTVDFLTELHRLTAGIADELCLFVIPSYTALYQARQAARDSHIRLGAQNMHWEDEGQFTGEISPVMLKELELQIIEIGHSERRHVMGETDEEENKKVLAALKHGFTPLLCVGETAQQKDYGIADEIIAMQLKKGLYGVTRQDAGRLWIAYEPVWAIGVGGTPATEDYAQREHRLIKDVLTELFGEEAHRIPVLYGGSVNPGNASEMMAQEAVDGLFVGRSAWDAEAFDKLIRQVLPVCKNK
ncbi:MAG: triose-phosphate isomerase [Christensenellales bacterium]|jgi:triosephosphate isomerase